MVSCSVKGCKFGDRKRKNAHLHRFPVDKTAQKVWIKFCNNTTINTRIARVCSLHFTKADYVRHLKYELLNLPVPGCLQKLKRGAVPTLCPPPHDAPPEATSGGAGTPPKSVADAVYHQGHCSFTDEQAPPETVPGGARTVADTADHPRHSSITDEQDHPVEVTKPPHHDVQVVEVKEELTWAEEAQDMFPLQEQDPLALSPEPVSWQSSDSQEEPQPQGREYVVYLKEEIDIKEEDVDSFSMEEVVECVTDRGGSLLQGPQEETEKLPVKRRKVMKAEV